MSDKNVTIRLIKYALLQTSIVPSLVCDLLVFSYIIRHWRKEIRDTPQNHVIAVLLLVSFLQKTTDAPMTLCFLRWGVVFRQTNAFCSYWGWADYALLVGSLHLITWCSIERHLFVFHSQMMKKKWCLIVFHYIPITFCLFYAPIIYFCLIMFPTMYTNVWDNTFMFCGGACYSYVPFLGTLDWLLDLAAPMLILFFANLLLFRRFLLQKRRRQQIIQFNKKRRIILQLSFTSLLYFVFMAPEIILGVIQALWLPTFALDLQVNYLYYTCYYTTQFLPYVIIGSLPGMRQGLGQWMDQIRRYFVGDRRIQPTIHMTMHQANKRLNPIIEPIRLPESML